MSGTAYENMTDKEREKYDWIDEIYNISANNSLDEDGAEAFRNATNANQTVSDLETEYEEVLNDQFEYNAEYDPLFQQYAAQYMQKGQMAMKNAIAESSILTGGYGNSWAMSAGAQAFNSQMDALYGLIPELRAASYDEWATDKKIKLEALGKDLDEAGELASTANADYEAAVADSQAEIIDYIAQGVMSGVITEDEIPTILPLYDNEFTEEEISALTEDILGTVEIYELKEAERNGVVADLIESIIKNPDLNNEKYLTAELGRHGYSYDDYMKAIFGSVNVAPINDLEPPKEEHIEKAKEKYAQSETAYLDYENELVAMGYDVSKLKDIVSKGIPQESEAIKGIKNRQYTRVEDTKNRLGGLDRNDKYTYVNSEGETVTQKGIDIRKELEAAGMSKEAATEWIEKYLQKDGK